MAFKDYLFSYNYDGARWGFTIRAESPEDAQQRVSRLVYATYDGEIVATVPASMGPLVRLTTAIRNFIRRRLTGLCR